MTFSKGIECLFANNENSGDYREKRMQSNDVSENWKFTTNSKKEEPVEKLLM